MQTEFSQKKKLGKRKDWELLWKGFGKTGSTGQRHESGRPKHARTEENVTAVDELVGVQSQEDQTRTHRSTHQICRDTCLIQSNVVQIIHRNVGLKCLFRLPKRLFPVTDSFCYICNSQGSSQDSLSLICNSQGSFVLVCHVILMAQFLHSTSTVLYCTEHVVFYRVFRVLAVPRD